MTDPPRVGTGAPQDERVRDATALRRTMEVMADGRRVTYYSRHPDPPDAEDPRGPSRSPDPRDPDEVEP